ncbi:hypothetical protein FIE12Z_12921 [Fusarium flagelliforme]|uniref:Uncharacterized protein n=1 Tax=Fusarium flagelliforme TaxID=2675880 RepID=A0A395M681_9HYPO|nr:hypothetical protein FIE12Z_12921 [Fusarium flagelliforme]
MWSELAGYRLNNYFFEPFRQFVSTASQLPSNTAHCIRLSGWTQLAEALGEEYTAADVDQLFFCPNDNSADNVADFASRGSPKRQPGFLRKASNKEYSEIFQAIKQNIQTFRFPNIKPLLHIKKSEGQRMKIIMELVVSWFNNSLTKINNQDNNKPPLQKDLAKGFEKTIEGLALAQGISRDEWCQEHLQLDPSIIPLDRWVEEESKELERKVLAHVQGNMEAFLGESVQEEADTLRGDGLLNDERDLSYKEPWYSLIKVIKSTAAHQVIPESWASLASGRERVEEDSLPQVQGDSQRAEHRTAPITHSLCQSLQALDEVRNNPALNTEEADIELGMVLNKPLLEWAMKRCRKALEQDNEILNPAQQKQVQRSYERYQQSLQMWEEKTAKDYSPRAHHSASSPPLQPTSAQPLEERHRAETAPSPSPSEASGCYTQEEPPALQHQELTQHSIIMDSQESSLPLSPIPQRQVHRGYHLPRPTQDAKQEPITSDQPEDADQEHSISSFRSEPIYTSTVRAPAKTEPETTS